MEGQINLFEYLNQQPSIGSIVYFITCNKIKKAIVISLDASFAGLPCTGYIKVQEPDGQIWSVKKFYKTKTEAKNYI